MGFLFGVQYGLICSIMFYLGTCELNPSIQWTHSNPLFTINRTHCVNPLSRVFFICPNTVTILTRLKTSQSSPQYENLWLVGQQGFEGCEVNKSIDKKLIDCNNPLNLLYYEVIFKRYSAVMSAPVFEPGREYYFIATSDGTRSSLDKTSGGRCSSHTMKLKFYVCTNNTVAANPGQERERSFKETTYFIAIGGLVFLCVLLIIVSVFSFYRLNRNSTRKSRSPSAQLV
ncbi:Ephrin-B2a [Porites harrisoni]